MIIRKGKYRALDSYREAYSEFTGKFDATEDYARQVQEFIDKHGAEYLEEPHITAFPKVKTFIGWREDRKLLRQLDACALQVAFHTYHGTLHDIKIQEVQAQSASAQSQSAG